MTAPTMEREAHGVVMPLLRVPGEPHDPAGAPGSLRVFRPARSYFNYRSAVWALSQLGAVLACVAAGVWVFLVGVAVLSNLAPGPEAHAHHPHSLASVVSPHAFGLLVKTVTAAVVAVVVLQAAFTYAVMRLDFSLRWYKVTDRSLRIREGVWNIRELTMAFANIQNISVTRGPIQRHFGVADLVVESAGGGAAKPGEQSLHTGYFRGVENAEEIKAMMLSRLRALQSGAMATPSASTTDTASTDDLSAALAGVRDEARGLRLAAERQTRRPA